MSENAPERDADTIYYGGSIVTMNDDQPNAEAVAVKGGKIVAVGNLNEVKKLGNKSTKEIDLKGKTLIPGFVDAHSHLLNVALLPSSANLLAPADNTFQKISDIQTILTEFIALRPELKEGDLVLGANYDDSRIHGEDGKPCHPTRWDLDKVSEDYRIIIMHQSTHMSVFNTRALEAANIGNGYIYKEGKGGGTVFLDKDGKPTGLMDENANKEFVTPQLPNRGIPDASSIQAALELYIAQGFTTVQEGRTDPNALGLLASAGLAVDVVAYPDVADYENANEKVKKDWPISQTYNNRFRVGGVKLILDGSPQGKTAWFTEPYLVPPASHAKDYCGVPIYSSEAKADTPFSEAEAIRLMTLAYANNWQVLVHANGDAAIDQLIHIVKATDKVPGGDRHTVLIHGQFLRANQIPELKKLGIFPSLFPLHTLYWGDWYVDSVTGQKRAEFISPTGAVLEKKMKLSIHSDAPVISPDSMRILDTAVNRKTRKPGTVLGKDQCLKPIDALKAMTIWAAYQHFEEETKGSIELGKAADFVVLSDNPLTVSVDDIIKITIEETIKDGESIYKRKPTVAETPSDKPLLRPVAA